MRVLLGRAWLAKMPVVVTACTMLPIVVTACTHERPITELHRVAGKPVVVETYNHERIDVMAIQAPDGVTFSTETTVLPPASVAKVTDIRRGRGAAEGAGIGFLVGAGIGAAMGFADGDDTCEDDGHWCLFVFSATDKAIMGGIALGTIGAVIGVVWGYASGSKFIYSYGDQVRVTPTGPPGSVAGATLSF